MSRRTGLSSRSLKLLATVREDGDYDPQDENRRSKSGTDVSPPCRVRWGESINPVQKEHARAADPNGGACLLTGRKVAIETSHALARATQHVTQLEWAWGMKKGAFYIDTRYNLLFLRADWYTLFDKDMWMLIPDKNDLKELERATARLEEVEQYRIALEELFNKNEHEYHFLPMPNMEEPICRYSGPNFDNHKEFKFPYHTLGTLKSHIKPHFVAYNAGMKLRSQNPSTVASQIFPRRQFYPDQSTIVKLQNLYNTWTGSPIPEDFADRQNEGEQGSDEDNNNDQGSCKGKSDPLQQSDNGRWNGRVMEGAEIEVDVNDRAGSEETMWVKEISNCVEKGVKMAQMEGGWDSIVRNDDQVKSYQKEYIQQFPWNINGLHHELCT
ncbi:hypothetical protein V8B97DRAFT_1878196 [Scleroderma yunnanense]